MLLTADCHCATAAALSLERKVVLSSLSSVKVGAGYQAFALSCQGRVQIMQARPSLGPEGELPASAFCINNLTQICDLLRLASSAHRPTPKLGTKDLNLTSTYASQIKGFGRYRELLQNWYDRLLETLGGAPTKVNEIIIPEHNARLTWHERMTEKGRPLCGGFLLEQYFVPTDGQPAFGGIQLTNFHTALGLEALALGYSAKLASSAAGGFGEGMKIEINLLVAKGVQVAIRSGSTVWHFDHRVEQADHEIRLLQVHVAEAAETPHLSVALLGPLQELGDVESMSHGQGIVERINFLFLQQFGPEGPMSEAERAQDSDLQLLFHESHLGRIYVMGIFVESPVNLIGIGFNFVGPKSKYDDIKFSRNRDSVNVTTLLYKYMLPVIDSTRQHRADFHAKAISHLYGVLKLQDSGELGKCLSGTGKLYDKRFTSLRHDMLRFANDLVAEFERQNQHLPLPLPVEDKRQEIQESLEDIQDQVKLLGGTLVPLPGALVAILRSSPACPTIDSLWKARELEVGRLAEWTFQDEQHQAVAEQ
jgi:hypothetical protein